MKAFSRWERKPYGSAMGGARQAQRLLHALLLFMSAAPASWRSTPSTGRCPQACDPAPLSQRQGRVAKAVGCGMLLLADQMGIHGDLQHACSQLYENILACLNDAQVVQAAGYCADDSEGETECDPWVLEGWGDEPSVVSAWAQKAAAACRPLLQFLPIFQCHLATLLPWLVHEQQGGRMSTAPHLCTPLAAGKGAPGVHQDAASLGQEHALCPAGWPNSRGWGHDRQTLHLGRAAWPAFAFSGSTGRAGRGPQRGRGRSRHQCRLTAQGVFCSCFGLGQERVGGRFAGLAQSRPRRCCCAPGV